MSKRKAGEPPLLDPDATDTDEDIPAAAAAAAGAGPMEKKARAEVLASLPVSDTLEVKPSLIPGAGLGVFARITLKKGDLIAPYVGERMTIDEFEARYDTDEKRDTRHYVLELPNDTVIDAEESFDSFARYINHQPRDKANAYRDGPLRDVLRARKRIPAGAEIYYDYGPHFVDEDVQRKPTAKVDPVPYLGKVPVGLRVGTSSLPGAGSGLFASGRMFRKGDRIIPYLGEELDEKAYFARYPTKEAQAAAKYVAAFPGGKWVDSVDPAKSSAARYINHKPNAELPNARLMKNGWIRAARTIADGEEIFMNYGVGYRFVTRSKTKKEGVDAPPPAAGAGAAGSQLIAPMSDDPEDAAELVELGSMWDRIERSIQEAIRRRPAAAAATAAAAEQPDDAADLSQSSADPEHLRALAMALQLLE